MASKGWYVLGILNGSIIQVKGIQGGISTHELSSVREFQKDNPTWGIYKLVRVVKPRPR